MDIHLLHLFQWYSFVSRRLMYKIYLYLLVAIMAFIIICKCLFNSIYDKKFMEVKFKIFIIKVNLLDINLKKNMGL